MTLRLASTAPKACPSHPDGTPALVTAELHELGRGRSGVVYLGRTDTGAGLARKVFGASGLTKIVQYLLLGAPNPYMWDRHAVECAHLRREILVDLVSSWFKGRLYVAASHGWVWNEEHVSFELQTQLVRGLPAKLHHPLRAHGEEDLRELVREILPRLQRHLLEAGFDGMVWQAGLGNPVALNNFLHEPVTGSDTAGRWAWIDLESGVPALAPANPLALFGFYLPTSIRLGRPLFDDVDVDRLRAYILREGFTHVLHKVDELAEHQQQWKSRSRLGCSIGYRLARRHIDRDQAEWYQTRPLRWYAREGSNAVRKIPSAGRAIVGWVAERLGRVQWRALGRNLVRFLLSQRYRFAVARGYAAGRIDAWCARGQMSGTNAAALQGHLDDEESAAYLTDFGVHLAIKPFVKGIEYWLLPLLFVLGVIDEVALVGLALIAGPIARSTYTGARIVQNALRGRECPWTALGVGLVPVLGNFAFPLQLLRSTRGADQEVARFIVYDGFTRMGAKVPIWGGEDTLTEHLCNRLPSRFMRSPNNPNRSGR